MPLEELRRHGYAAIDWLVDYLGSPGEYPVLSRCRPGEVRDSQPTEAPESSTSIPELLEEFRDAIVPGITHWNHPGFMAYFGTTASGPGILGEILTAALNVNAMLWRTSPAATEIEEVAVDWLRQMLGLPAIFHGHIQDTASTSSMVALAAAREALGIDVRRRGLAGAGSPILRIYCSREAHSSIDKAAITLGLGLDGVERLPVDRSYRMDPAALNRALERDLAAGIRPMAVVATIGTTSTTSIDPVREIAAICREHGVWLHVDGAYGGAASVVPELRDRVRGWEAADSIVVNPHKWLFVPMDCSVLFFARPEIARASYALTPDYLSTAEGGGVTNLMEYGPALGRRFRGLKLWLVLRHFGRSGIADALREHMRMARSFSDWIAAEKDWSVVAPVPFSTVCFRYTPAGASGEETDRWNSAILDRVNGEGRVFLSHTKVEDRYTIRLAIGNLRTEMADVEAAWAALRNAARSVREGLQPH